MTTSKDMQYWQKWEGNNHKVWLPWKPICNWFQKPRQYIVIPWWMHNIVGWAWASAWAERGQVACIYMTVIRMWLNLRPLNITQKVHTCTTQEQWVRPS